MIIILNNGKWEIPRNSRNFHHFFKSLPTIVLLKPEQTSDYASIPN